MCALDPDLSLLGPIGAAIVTRVGNVGAAWIAAGSLAAWSAVATAAGWWLFRRAQA